MWRGQTVSVVLPTYAEKGSIRSIVEGFLETQVVDEVVVVNNNAESGTSEAIAPTAAHEIFEAKPGLGNAVRRGLNQARGDLIVLCEPDDTFLPSDIHKLLAYSDDFDAVFGTRTTRQLIWPGANMGFALKWGNWAVAKLVEVLFRTSHLSDVGCTYRLMRRETFTRINPSITIGGNYCLPELTLLTIMSGARYVEVPVNYRERKGVSSVTGSLTKAFWLGWQMIGFILWFRLKSLGRLPRPASPQPVGSATSVGHVLTQAPNGKGRAATAKSGSALFEFSHDAAQKSVADPAVRSAKS